MSYRILKSKINDTGIDTDDAIDKAIADLAAQVDSAEGWEPIGGVHTLSRQKPNGLRIWLLQAVREVPKEAIQVEGTLEEVIARHNLKVIADECRDPTVDKKLMEETKIRPEHADKSRKVSTAARSALST